MAIYEIKPIINVSVRVLCRKSYPNHPKGCPNFGKRDTCPPHAPLLVDFFNMHKKILAVVVDFNLKKHKERMKKLHPGWTEKQCACCLYWQGGVRKKLKEKVDRTIQHYYKGEENSIQITDCPEAMGVDVTSTMKNVGVRLEWPPKRIVRKITFIGYKQE